jgi:hypothetical protein
MQRFQFLKTTAGLFLLLTISIMGWMVYTLTEYLKNDLLLIRFLVSNKEGWPVLGGVLSIFLFWMLELKLLKKIKRWWKRWFMRLLIFGGATFTMYFWWNQLVVDFLVSNIRHLYLREMTIQQALKLVGLCTILFLPSVVLSGRCFIKTNPVYDHLCKLLLWVVMCIGLAIPINQYWWQIAFPIQPLADLSFLPYAGSYHEAVKLIAGANSVRFVLIAWGKRR